MSYRVISGDTSRTRDFERIAKALDYYAILCEHGDIPSLVEIYRDGTYLFHRPDSMKGEMFNADGSRFGYRGEATQ